MPANIPVRDTRSTTLVQLLSGSTIAVPRNSQQIEALKERLTALGVTFKVCEGTVTVYLEVQ